MDQHHGRGHNRGRGRLSHILVKAISHSIADQQDAHSLLEQPQPQPQQQPTGQVDAFECFTQVLFRASTMLTD